MATSSSTSIYPDNSTDAAFRVWVAFVSALLDAAGFTKTADTGQINTATVLKPSATNTSQGYEIRAFVGDPLQATAPIFFKIEYGSGSATGNPSLWLTFGTGSDGAGTITNIFGARKQFASAGTSTSSGNKCFASGSAAEGRLALVLWPTGSTNFPLVVVFERTRDSSGADTSTGLYIIAQTGTTKYAQFFPRNGLNIPAAETLFGCLCSGAETTGQLSTDVYCFAIRHFNKQELPAMKFVVAYFDSNFTAESPVSLTHYGASMTFMPIGNSQLGSIAQGNTSTRMAIRWG